MDAPKRSLEAWPVIAHPGDPTSAARLIDSGTPGAALVLTADDPAALAGFYGGLLQVEVAPGWGPGHWRVPWPPGGWLEIYAPSRSRPLPRQPGRLALCLQRTASPDDALAVLAAWIAAAIEAGAIGAEPPRLEAFGAEVWLKDPEGNRLLLLVR